MHARSCRCNGVAPAAVTIVNKIAQSSLRRDWDDHVQADVSVPPFRLAGPYQDQRETMPLSSSSEWDPYRADTRGWFHQQQQKEGCTHNGSGEHVVCLRHQRCRFRQHHMHSSCLKLWTVSCISTPFAPSVSLQCIWER